MHFIFEKLRTIKPYNNFKSQLGSWDNKVVSSYDSPYQISKCSLLQKHALNIRKCISKFAGFSRVWPTTSAQVAQNTASTTWRKGLLFTTLTRLVLKFQINTDNHVRHNAHV